MQIRDLFPDVLTEDLKHEYKATLSRDNTLKWLKTIIAFANADGGVVFIGVSNEGEAFGLNLDEIDKLKNLIAVENDRHVFPHAKISYMLRSVDSEAEHFVLAVKVARAESVVRYRAGDFNEIVYIKGDGNATPATPEEIISLHRRKFGVDKETTDTSYSEGEWMQYLSLCQKYRADGSKPGIKELQNEEIVTKDGLVKSGFIMFRDDYDGDDTLICARLWKGNDKTGDVLDAGRFKGSIAKIYEETLKFIERNTKSGWRKKMDGGREEIRAYPLEAIREALVNAIAHRDYSIPGTQIDVDIYNNRIDIVSPGSWLLPKPYDAYPEGAIPSIRRNFIIAACLDVANLMERGGTGFQTMIESYRGCPDELQPVISIYPGFLDLRLYDKLYERTSTDFNPESLPAHDKLITILKSEGAKSVKELQSSMGYENRGRFLKEVINPLIEEGKIYRDGKIKSPTSLIKLV